MVLKSKEEARANLEASLAYIPSRYESGVKKADWATPAGSEQAEKNYADAIAKAVTAKDRQKGVRKVSNTDWQTAAATKGAPIIADRIRGALGEWEANWGPMYDKVSSKVKTLPPKTVNWRTNITTRLVPTVEEWRKAAGKT